MGKTLMVYTFSKSKQSWNTHSQGLWQGGRLAVSNLSTGYHGILVSHTHPPGFEYHSYPRDYFRFMHDWWEDLPDFFPEIELLELHEANFHVFSCYRRNPE